jgi:hypothetical protein
MDEKLVVCIVLGSAWSTLIKFSAAYLDGLTCACAMTTCDLTSAHIRHRPNNTLGCRQSRLLYTSDRKDSVFNLESCA